MATLGTQPGLWHLAIVVTGLISASLLYATFRSLRVPNPAAALLAVWLLVAPGVSAVWVRLGTNETTATLFLVAAMWLATRAARSREFWVWEAAFVISSLAAMLSKEAFALVGLALAAFRIMAGRTLGEKRRWPIGAALVAACGVVLSAFDLSVAASAGGESYGGAFLRAPGLRDYAIVVAHNFAIMVFAASGWLGLLVLVGAIRRPPTGQSREIAIWATLAAGLLVVPQLVLYSRTGVVEGKYELPCALGVAAAVVAGLAWLKANHQDNYYRVGLALFGASVAAFAISTRTYAEYFAVDSQQLHDMVLQVARTAPPSAVVGVAGDPAGNYEPTFSLIDHFAAAGRSDVTIRALPIDNGSDHPPRQVALAQTLLSTVGQVSPASVCRDVSAVIVMPDVANPDVLPCPGEFQTLDFVRPVLLWGGDHVRLRPQPPGAVITGYTLLQRRAEAAAGT
jgi:hypothetical protein